MPSVGKLEYPLKSYTSLVCPLHLTASCFVCLSRSGQAKEMKIILNPQISHFYPRAQEVYLRCDCDRFTDVIPSKCTCGFSLSLLVAAYGHQGERGPVPTGEHCSPCTAPY